MVWSNVRKMKPVWKKTDHSLPLSPPHENTVIPFWIIIKLCRAVCFSPSTCWENWGTFWPTCWQGPAWQSSFTQQDPHQPPFGGWAGGLRLSTHSFYFNPFITFFSPNFPAIYWPFIEDHLSLGVSGYRNRKHPTHAKRIRMGIISYNRNPKVK